MSSRPSAPVISGGAPPCSGPQTQGRTERRLLHESDIRTVGSKGIHRSKSHCEKPPVERAAQCRLWIRDAQSGAADETCHVTRETNRPRVPLCPNFGWQKPASKAYNCYRQIMHPFWGEEETSHFGGSSRATGESILCRRRKGRWPPPRCPRRPWPQLRAAAGPPPPASAECSGRFVADLRSRGSALASGRRVLAAFCFAELPKTMAKSRFVVCVHQLGLVEHQRQGGV